MAICFSKYRPLFGRFPTPNLLRLMQNLQTRTGLAWCHWKDEDGNICPGMHSGFVTTIDDDEYAHCSDPTLERLVNGFASRWDKTADTKKTRKRACRKLFELVLSVYEERARNEAVVRHIFAPLPQAPEPVFASHSMKSSPIGEFISAHT
jgi:hypothetical protein